MTSDPNDNRPSQDKMHDVPTGQGGPSYAERKALVEEERALALKTDQAAAKAVEKGASWAARLKQALNQANKMHR